MLNCVLIFFAWWRYQEETEIVIDIYIYHCEVLHFLARKTDD